MLQRVSSARDGHLMERFLHNLAASIAVGKLIIVSTPNASTTVIPNPVPSRLKHEALINRLIQCESSGRNISHMDSNNRMSDGILQFNRGPNNTLEGGTSEEMCAVQGFRGTR